MVLVAAIPEFVSFGFITQKKISLNKYNSLLNLAAIK
jgi:hypothetical protein